jgi:hypothetical protein
LIEQEWQAMVVTVNFENIPLLREPIDRAHAKGRTEGMAEATQRLLERRFPGQVPDGPLQLTQSPRRISGSAAPSGARPSISISAEPIIQSIWMRLAFAPRARSSSGLSAEPLTKHLL